MVDSEALDNSFRSIATNISPDGGFYVSREDFNRRRKIARRMKAIDTIYENCPNLCWAELVMWAMYGRDVSLTGAENCRTSNGGNCYCGRFFNGEEQEEV